MKTGEIYLGDCLEVMNKIPDGSIDMILCDLPYQVLKADVAKWDRIIPFEPLWQQYERVIKERGAIILFASGMFTANLMMSNKKLWRYNLVWNKIQVSGFLNANRMPLRQHEDICVFYKKMPEYHPQMVKVGWHSRNHSKGDLSNKTHNCYGAHKNLPTVYSDEKYPTSILTFSKNQQVNTLHPTQKPVDLLRWLIRTYTVEGEVVLDNAMGSGSTCIAAIQENRKYIGIEKDQTFYDIAQERINAELGICGAFSINLFE